MGRYLIGIDLGTTNSAMGVIDLSMHPRIDQLGLKTFPMRQLVDRAEIGQQSLLPSFLYLPGENDLPPGSTSLPWHVDNKDIIGAFARKQGSRIPGRLVSSAKSWLGHAGVDRTSALLPWGAPAEVQRLSPLEVSTRYLRHMVDCWNFDHPKDLLEDQEIVLTIPASFDDVARNLTLQAAQNAGMKQVTLLEEPQAAFYCWIALSPIEESVRMAPGMRCVVVDVGGGTSDFSLILAGEEQGELSFIREAVGDHLLLGGDNMDHALAHRIEKKWGANTRLDSVQFSMLVQSCRQAKEVLLAENPPEKYPIQIIGRGRSVIGGSLHSSLSLAEIQEVLLDGFFPFCDLQSEPQRTARSGLQEMGLPYVHDPAITHHLASFLRRQLKPDERPDTILFNGGVFQPGVIRQRLVEVMQRWYEPSNASSNDSNNNSNNRSWSPMVLVNPSLDLAVAWGAAYYAWLKHVGGKRIGGGIPRSYYIGIETGQKTEGSGLHADKNESSSSLETQPSEGKSDLQSVLCILPRHLEEGSEVKLEQPILELALGEPILFPLYSSTVRGGDQAGQVFNLSSKQILSLPAVHTILRGGKRSGIKKVPVTLQARSTPIGTLELYCVAEDQSNRWKLEFSVRDVVFDLTKEEGDKLNQRVEAIIPEENVQLAGDWLRKTFVEGSFEPKELTKKLEMVLESPRGDWSMYVCRRLWEFLSEVAPQRSRSGAHLNRWYSLVGYCLRPGFGDPLDRYRIDQLWKLLASPTRQEPGVKNNSINRNANLDSGADYWIMWRRVAGGLTTGLQQTLWNRLRPILLPGKGKSAGKTGANEWVEMWRTVASLERLDTGIKQSLGEALLQQLKRPPLGPHLFWSLTRLGARSLFYGPLNTILHPEIVEKWLKQILEYQPQNEHEHIARAFAMAQFGRLTGQRALDIDQDLRETIKEFFAKHTFSEEWNRMLSEVTINQSEEYTRLFGESLPVGLRLMNQ